MSRFYITSCAIRQGCRHTKTTESIRADGGDDSAWGFSAYCCVPLKPLVAFVKSLVAGSGYYLRNSPERNGQTEGMENQLEGDVKGHRSIGLSFVALVLEEEIQRERNKAPYTLSSLI